MFDLTGVPEYFSSGIMRVAVLPGDVVRFVMGRQLENGEWEPVVSILCPACAVPANMDLIMGQLGARVARTGTVRVLS